MSPVAQWGGRRRWLVGAGGALLLLLGVATLVRVPARPPLQPTPPARPTIQFGATGRGDAALTDQAAMHDQMPLFLPTERNVPFRPPPLPEAGRSVLDRDAHKLAFGDGTLVPIMPPPLDAPQKPVDTLTMAAPTPLFGLGRVDTPPLAAPPRGGFIEVLAAGSNRRELALPLDPAARPPTDKAWRPLELLALIDAAGLAAPLVVVVRSEVDEVDRYFRNYLAQRLRLGDRLPPGSYRIIVAP